jgi:hypothetical protein
MDVHKDCYSAINLTQQGGPHRRETDHLHLTVVKGYLRKLITNDRVARYLEQYQPELFIEFQKIAEMTSTLPSETA